MQSSTEVENLDTKTSSKENKPEAVDSESATTHGSVISDGSTSQGGRADHKFYVPPCALVFYVMAFLGVTFALAMRASLSVAIVAMVNQTAVSEAEDVVTANNTDTNTDQCPRDQVLQTGSGEFIWNRHEQGAVLAAYYYGQQVTMVGPMSSNL